MASAETFFKDIKRNPERYYIVHYSSETLFEPDGNKAMSPRITSIVVRHNQSGQTLSFATTSMKIVMRASRSTSTSMERPPTVCT